MALKNQEQVVELADKITACADSIHNQLIKDIKDNKIDQSKSQLIFQDEQILRQRASSLYIDAANCVVAGLQESQENLIELINIAKEKIETVKRIASCIDLIADLLVLAAAAYAAKPDPILSALKEIKVDIEALT
jgi:hypothetical protein